jgi:hypothetical protein
MPMLRPPTVRTDLWEVSPNNPKTAGIEQKLTNPEWQIFRNLPEWVTPSELLQAKKEWYVIVWRLFEWVNDHVMSSSTAVNLLWDSQKVPDDIDASFSTEQFYKVMDNARNLVSKWDITDLQIKSIDWSIKWNIADPEIIKGLLESWNIKLSFYTVSSTWLKTEVELFAEWDWIWLVQLWTMPREVVIIQIDWVNINILAMKDVADWYAINLIDELWKEWVENFVSWDPKAKAWPRLNALLQELWKHWLSSPDKLLDFMDKVLDKYQEYKWQREWKFLDRIAEKLPKAKEKIKPIIERFERHRWKDPLNYKW